jgi:AcrR family transcriptional regulator
MTAPRGRRNPTPRPARGERRRLVLEQARQWFAAHGYAATTLEQVAGAAGLTVAAVSRLFPTRRDLFEAMLGEVRAITLEAWENITADLPDPIARLHAVTEAYLTGTRQHADTFRVLHRALAEDHEETRPLLRAFYQDCEAFVARLIAEGQQSGFFRRSLDPRVGAWELIRTALAYTLLQPLGLPLYDNPDYLPRAIECALHCLLKTDV